MDDLEERLKKMERRFSIGDMNADTLVAIMMLEKNIKVIKNSIVDVSILNRYKYVIDMIYKDAPHANRRIVNRLLLKNFIFTRLQVNMLIGFLLIVFLYGICLLVTKVGMNIDVAVILTTLLSIAFPFWLLVWNIDND